LQEQDNNSNAMLSLRENRAPAGNLRTFLPLNRSVRQKAAEYFAFNGKIILARQSY